MYTQSSADYTAKKDVMVYADVTTLPDGLLAVGVHTPIALIGSVDKNIKRRASTSIPEVEQRSVDRVGSRVYRVESLNTSVVERALAGNDADLRRLVDILTPIIQARVARRLLSSGHTKDVRQDVQDHCQNVFLHLFDKSGQVLKAWDPERGMSLENYVGLVAERRVISSFRSSKSNPWRESESYDELEEAGDSAGDVEREVLGDDELESILECMQSNLTPLGWHLFVMLYIQEKSVDDVKEESNLSSDSVYAWRSRLRKQARKCKEWLEEQHNFGAVRT